MTVLRTTRAAAVLVAGIVTLAAAGSASAVPAIQYSYDAAGRLQNVTNLAGASATYKYDKVGNITAITRAPSASARAVAARTPAPIAAPRPVLTGAGPGRVRVGSRVTILGRNFSSSPATDVVRIGPLLAQVLAASSTRLVVAAPPGHGGVVIVQTPGGQSRGGRVTITGSPTTSPVRFGPTERLRPPRLAAPGTTALTGLVQRSDGRPIAGIKVTVSAWGDTYSARTSRSGWFLLSGLYPGRGTLTIDGGASAYGIYSEPVQIAARRTTVLPWITYLTRLDMKASVALASPTTKPITLTSPKLPGFEIEIPKGTVIIDSSGRVVRRLSLTRLRFARTPFPWAPGMMTPYFTLQPGDATVRGPGLRVIYPNFTGQLPGTTIPYLAENPDWGSRGSGWYVSGSGHVSANGRQIVPDAGTVLHDTYVGGNPASPGCKKRSVSKKLRANCPKPGGKKGGEPVDLETGLFEMNATDLHLNDVLPVTLGRVYRPADDVLRDFGIGMSSSLNYYINVSSDVNGDFELDLPDGGQVLYGPTSTNGVYDAVGTPTEFSGSTLTQLTGDTSGPFTIALKNGTTLRFGNPNPAFLTQITDRFGNTVMINRTGETSNFTGGYPAGGGQLVSVTTPSGRWLKFTHGTCLPGGMPSQCITSVTDNLGRTVRYSYDSNGRLVGVTDANGGHTTYAWAPCTSTLTCTELVSITDPLGIKSLTNTYDSSGDVTEQQLPPGGGTWRYSYTLDSSGTTITKTTTTDPRGIVSDYTFDANGYPSSQTIAAGTPVAQTTSTVYDPTTNQLTSMTDPLGRVTDYTYDAVGNVLSETDNAGTSSATKWTYTYEPKFNRIATVTDALGQTRSFSYNDLTPSVTATDVLGRKTVVTLNHEGQPIQITDPAGDTSYMSYLNGLLVGAADAMGDATRMYNDAAGRPLKVTDPLGHVTTYTWNPRDEQLSQTDALGDATVNTYDRDGDLTSVTDANGNKTSFKYDEMLRPTSETDSLGNTASVTYDDIGNVLSTTDPKGNVAKVSYDALGRTTKAEYGVSGSSANKTITYTYDAGNRLTKAVDSVAGTYSFSYDGLDDVRSAVSPQGTVSYTYDSDQLPTSMTVAGQPTVSYVYNADGVMTKITRGAATVTFGYDADQRPTSTTLPDGIVRSESFDAASRPTAISFARGSTQLGVQDYAYTRDSQLATESGSLASVNLPAAIASASYNTDNELTKLGSTTLTYDKDGNLTSDGTDSYSWNPEGQLAGVTGASTAATFTYDPLGRRATEASSGKTTSFLYDGENVVQSLSGGTPTANMLTGALDQTYLISDSAGTSSLLTDHLGSAIALANGSGALTTRYSYNPFGATTAAGPSDPNKNQYIGAQNDPTGLYYLDNRYYDPSLDRFVSEDPLGFAGGTTDLYQYVSDQPTDQIDPTGLDSSGRTPPKSWWQRVKAWFPNGGGISFGGTAEAGAGSGGAAQITWGGGYLGGQGFGGWQSVRPPGQVGSTEWVAGAYGGGGFGVWVTNASNGQGLSQIPQTASVNLGIGWPADISVQVGYANGTWIVGVSPPVASAGGGLSFSALNTTTTTGGWGGP